MDFKQRSSVFPVFLAFVRVYHLPPLIIIIICFHKISLPAYLGMSFEISSDNWRKGEVWGLRTNVFKGK